jgi:site-specific DNA-cytosine methylase
VSTPLLMIDLFAGLGGASAAMRARRWEVVTVDLDPQFGCDVTGDIRRFHWIGRRPDLVWASPPCVQFSRSDLPWIRSSDAPSLELVQATLDWIAAVRPRWWVVENVRGAIRWVKPLLGEPRHQARPWFLWGEFPPIRFAPGHWKRCRAVRNAARRAAVPLALSHALAVAIESTLPGF